MLGKLTSQEIADRYEVPLSWVGEAFISMEPSDQEIVDFDTGKELAKGY